LASDVWNSIVLSFGRVILTNIPPVAGRNTARVRSLVMMALAGRDGWISRPGEETRSAPR
jgi:hypothetical protein